MPPGVQKLSTWSPKKYSSAFCHLDLQKMQNSYALENERYGIRLPVGEVADLVTSPLV